MNLSLSKALFFLTISFVANFCFAAEGTENANHTLGYKWGFADLTSNVKLEDKDTKPLFESFYYSYEFNPNVSIIVGATSGHTSCIVICVSGTRYFDYKSKNLGLILSMPIAEQLRVYGQASAVHYKFKYSGGDRPSYEDDGYGSLLAVGIEYRFKNGFGVGLEQTLKEMGDLSGMGTVLNLSYKFDF